MSVAMSTQSVSREPIDIQHLRSVTFDDEVLEREILAMFGERASAALIAIEQSDDKDERTAAAHRLVGAARAIGAGDLAEAAHRIETAETLTDDAVAALSRATAAVISFLEYRMSAQADHPNAG